MPILLIAILTISLIGIITCLSIKGPMIRAFEDRHGLTDSRKAVTEARKARTEAKVKAAELDQRKSQLRNQLDNIASELSRIDVQLKAMPQMVYTLVFELWARPRLLRCRSRTAQAAMATALARFPAADGFTVRPAERISAAQGD